MGLDQAVQRVLDDMLRRMLARVCEEQADTDVPTRSWRQFLPTGINAYSSMRVAQEDWPALARRLTNSSRPEFREVVDFFLTRDDLRSALRLDDATEKILIENRVLQELIFPVLAEYFVRKAKVAFDPQLINTLLAEVAVELDTQAVPMIQVYPLTNLRLTDGPIELRPGLKLRQTERRDAELWLNMGEILGGSLPLSVVSLGCILEESSKHPVGVGMELPSEDARQVLTALRLLADQETRIAIAFVEPRHTGVLWRWMYSGVMVGHRPAILWPGLTFALESSQHSELIQVWRSLRESPNAQRLSLAMRRWDSGEERWRDDDRFLDYWFALESIFTSDSRHEIGYRARMRIAAFVGSTSTERAEIYDRVNDSYDTRSKIAHGEKVPEPRLKADMLATRSYLRRGLRTILSSKEAFDPRQIDNFSSPSRNSGRAVSR